MKVKALIEKLAALDPDLEVSVQAEDDEGTCVEEKVTGVFVRLGGAVVTTLGEEE